MKRTTRNIYIIAFILATIFATKLSAKNISIAKRISRHLQVTKSFKVDYGIMIVAIRNEKFVPVFVKNADMPLIPASNEKLITTIGAIQELGDTFSFNTVLGFMQNDLVVIGDGDPGFGDTQLTNKPTCEIFDKWAQELRNKGITYISGNLIFDASIFDNVFRHPDWPVNQFNKWYTAPVGGLNLNDNCIDLEVRIGQKKNNDENSRLIIKPFTDTIKIRTIWQRNHSLATIINTSWASENELILKITLGVKSAGPVSIPVQNPIVFFANICRERLESYGITITGKTLFKRVRLANGTIPKKFVELSRYTTPIFDNVKRANKKSQNLFAECLFKRTGFAYARKHGGFAVGSWTSGQYAYANFLKKELNISSEEFCIDDGGGLSRNNRISARAICKLLQFVLHQRWAKKFVDTLAIAGKDGTLRKRMRNSIATKKIRAKTGYISSVSALSGYLVDESENVKVIFSMLFNNFPRAKLWQIKQIQDRICMEISREYGNAKHGKN